MQAEPTSRHEHIKNISTRGAILTENKLEVVWQKDSYTTKVVRKIQDPDGIG